MAKNIQAIRGMNDYLPGETALWQRIEGSLKQVLGSYGYSEIRLPIVEQTPLFKRAIGEVTDVVEKEMYTFEDRNGDSLTLRPELCTVSTTISPEGVCAAGRPTNPRARSFSLPQPVRSAFRRGSTP